MTDIMELHMGCRDLTIHPVVLIYHKDLMG